MTVAMRGERSGARPRRRGQRAQSLVEAALIMPTFIVLALGVADIGRGFAYREDVTNAARDAGRVAALSGQQVTGNSVCAAAGSGATSASATAHVTHQGTDSAFLDITGSGTGKPITLSVALESSSDGTTGSSKLSTATVTVTWHCLSGAAVTNTTATSKDPASVGSATIQVHVAYPFTLITPLMGTISAPTLKADIYVRAEY